MSEQIARQFHDTYERLAPQFGYETREDTKVFDPQSQNGRLMIAVCAEVIGEIGRDFLEKECKRLKLELLCAVNAIALIQKIDPEQVYEVIKQTTKAGVDAVENTEP